MNRKTAYGWVLAGALWGGVAPVQAGQWSVPADFWFTPRSAQNVLQQPDIRAAVTDWLQQPGSMLRLHHAPGDESALQADELRYWLMALALDGKRILLQADLPPNQPIQLETENKKGNS